MDQGDKFSGTITHSVVGGRGNSNQINNNNAHTLGAGKRESFLDETLSLIFADVPKLSAREIELNERLVKAREKIAEKKERERLQKMEDELRELEAQLGED